MLRITGGIHRGVSVKSRKGLQTRPTASKVREAIFNILADSIKDSRVLDLYSGSGILGYEALSRGAEYCYFVEYDRRCCHLIRQNLQNLDLNGHVLCAKVECSIKSLSQNSFNIVFVDPPYSMGIPRKLLSQFVQSGILSGNSQVIIEHSSKINGENIENLTLFKVKKYGDTSLSIYKLSNCI